MFGKLLLSFSLCFLLASPLLADDTVKLVTSTTDLAWAAKEIGGKFVDAKALLNGTENPHYVDTIPEFIRLVADAQIVCIVGLELEIGWMPKVVARSGNAQVQPGGSGYCEVGKGAPVLEKPAGAVDRSMGDIHPSGNPHFWLGPKAFAEAAGQIKDVLVRVDSKHAADYLKNYTALQKKLGDLQDKLKTRLAPLVAKSKGAMVIEYHKEFSYFFAAYGITSMGSIEEKPGVLPSAGRVAEISLAAKAAGVKVALGGLYAPKQLMARFSELSGIAALQVATSLQPNGKIKDYVQLQTELVDAVAQVLQK